MKKILLTGSTSFLGSKFIELYNGRFDILGIARSDYLYPIDLLDFNAVKKVYEDFQPDIVIHCAADVGIDPSTSSTIVQTNSTAIDDGNKDINTTTYNFKVGFFAEGKDLEGILTVNYRQFYDIENKTTNSGVSIAPQLKIGENTYGYAGGEFSVSDNGLNRNLFLIGLGQEKFKLTNNINLPIGWRAAYFNDTEGYETDTLNVEETESGIIFTIELNDNDWFKSNLSPLNLIPKNR